jgi:hypothetical protein
VREEKKKVLKGLKIDIINIKYNNVLKGLKKF